MGAYFECQGASGIEQRTRYGICPPEVNNPMTADGSVTRRKPSDKMAEEKRENRKQKETGISEECDIWNWTLKDE